LLHRRVDVGELFTQERVTDAKRVARGIAYYTASQMLGERACPRVLMLAGRAPAGDLRAIKAAFPTASVTAIDRDAAACEAAVACGANEVLHGDLTDGRDARYRISTLSHRRFDFVSLDLCAPVSGAVDLVRRVAHQHLTMYGVLAVTCSYGREPAERVEYYEGVGEIATTQDDICSWDRRYGHRIINSGGLPLSVIGRGCQLIPKLTSARFDVEYFAAYRGKSTPMLMVVGQKVSGKLSPAWWCESPSPAERARVVPGAPALKFDDPISWIVGLDLEAPRAADLFDLPVGRLAALKASHARRLSALREETRAKELRLRPRAVRSDLAA
jgi:hypothetical protein